MQRLKTNGLTMSCTGVCCLLLVAPVAVADDAKLTFEKDVRPIFRAHCFDCHGAEVEMKGQLDLRLKRFLLKGGESGPAIVPGDVQASYLLDRVRSGEMPPGEHRVPAAQVKILEEWVKHGAPTAREEPKSLPPGLGITPEERSWWSFQPIERPTIPRFSTNDRVRTDVDALLLQRMKPRGLAFSPDADKRTSMLRVYFDLIGLAPSSAEAEEFLQDDSPEAYSKLIDRLLKSPHYGERWGRHWLDVAGYADSEGSTTSDQPREWAYKYRDYVIRSFNTNKPFDQFLIEQLAGDELVPQPHRNLSPQQIEQLTATGFLRMGADGTGSGANTDEARNQVIGDTLKIVSTSLLGLSVGCAQCHDHRYDPIPQTDYYRLRAVFEPAYDWKRWRTPQQRRVSLYTDADRKRAAELETEANSIASEKNKKQTEYMKAAFAKELTKYEEPLRSQIKAAYENPASKRTAEQKALLKKHPSANISPGVLYQYNQAAADDLKKYDARIAAVRGKKPKEEFLRVLFEQPGQIPETRLFYRGDYRQPKDVITPGSLTVTAAEGEQLDIPANNAELKTSGRRLAFAKWLVNGQHPLVARVIVNRVWMHHMGRPLVGTPADFGRLGEHPSHPQLLDYLADEFMKSGWNLNHLHRLILTSTVYRQSSFNDQEKSAIDPANRLYWRKPLQRLEAEILRDRMLQASGRLNRTPFGAPVSVKEDDTGQVIVAGDDVRRSVYLQVRRSQPVAFLHAFDAPEMVVNCEKRQSSTVATQALMLMNSDYAVQQAKHFANRVATEAKTPLPADWLADLPALPKPPAELWHYGYGSFDEQTLRTSAFTKLAHWTGSNWQGGEQRPDSVIGWTGLNASGGHTGTNPDYAAIRRFIVPASGQLHISGILHHPSEPGDGVRGRIVSSRHGLLGTWVVHNKKLSTLVEKIAMEAGDTIDFITDARTNVNTDSFLWEVSLTLTDSTNQSLGSWNSKTNFKGPAAGSTLPLPQQVALAWELAYCAPPTKEELQLSVQFLARQLRYLHLHLDQLPKDTTPQQQAMINFCQTLMSSSRFLYMD